MDTKEYYQEVYLKTVFPQHLIEEADWRIVDGVIPEGKQILSIGCGTGSDVAYLTRQNKVYGTDILGDAVETAKANGLEAIQGNVEDELPYEDEVFDIVVAKDVMEHIFYPEKLIAEIRRVLKSQGYAIINVPNHFYYRMRLRLFLGKGIIWFDHPSKEWDYFHIRFFTFKGYNEFLKTCRIKLVQFFYDLGTYCYSSTMYYDQSPLLKHRILKFLFPRKVRGAIARVSPNLLCGSFYARIVKEEHVVT